MDDLRFYVLFNSFFSVILGQWADNIERCAMELRLRLRRFIQFKCTLQKCRNKELRQHKSHYSEKFSHDKSVRLTDRGNV